MIDPTNVTKYNRTLPELEEFILFCVLVAGKKASRVSKQLSELIDGKGRPFDVMRKLDLETVIKPFGCYKLKSRAIKTLLENKLDLKNCTLEDLIKVPGIGYKTATFFLLHTRENLEIACLDTHILRWLRDNGFDTPKTSPQSFSQYQRIQNIYLDICKKNKISPSVLDLAIWNVYSKSKLEDQKILESIEI